MADSGAIKVFLLDDHEIVRRGLRDLLEAEDDLVVIGESGSAREAERIIPPCARRSPCLTRGSPTAPESTSAGRSGHGIRPYTR